MVRLAAPLSSESVRYFSLLTPLFGVVLGAWLLDEALTLHFIAGCLFVLAGVGFVTQGRR